MQEKKVEKRSRGYSEGQRGMQKTENLCTNMQMLFGMQKRWKRNALRAFISRIQKSNISKAFKFFDGTTIKSSNDRLLN